MLTTTTLDQDISPERQEPYNDLTNSSLLNFSNSRVLVIDDVTLILEELKLKLDPYFLENNNNLLEFCADPEKVLDLVRAAKIAERPYDALILDLQMPKLNGDAIIRQLAEHDLLLPIVIHSASHAEDLQFSILGQVDEVRTELSLLDQKNHNTNVPCRFVAKYDTDYSIIKVVRALKSVMLLADDVNWAEYKKLAANFKIKPQDCGDKTEYCEELSQICKLIGFKGIEILNSMMSFREHFDTSRKLINRKTMRFEDCNFNLLDLYKSMAEEFCSKEYSFKGLSEVANDLGATRRHGINARINLISLGFKNIIEMQYLWGSLIGPDLKSEILEYRKVCRAAIDQIFLLAKLTKPISNFKLQSAAMACAMGGSPKHLVLEMPEESIIIKGKAAVFKGLIEQIVLNALSAVKEQEQPKVELKIAKINFAEIPEQARQQFLIKNETGVTYACVSVTDNGSGIPEDLRTKIFDRNFTTKSEGTGFGLWFLKKHLVDFDAAYHLESEVGKGTTFSIYCPIELEEQKSN
jgi:CheY-like chemotaxis protein